MSDKNFFVNGAAEIVPPVNDTPYKRILAIGDVHGNFTRLMSLWQKLDVTDRDLAIFLGDFVDRGMKVAEVLEWVITQSAKKNFVFLRGNHEQMMLDAFSKERRGSRIFWVVNGGRATIAGLKDLRDRKIFDVEEVLNFVDALPLSYTLEIGGRRYFFCHAGINPNVPLDEQTEDSLLWVRDEFFNRYDGDAVIVTGHTPVQTVFDFGNKAPQPMKIPGRNILLTDTGSFTLGGKISCVDILSGQYWQSNDMLPDLSDNMKKFLSK